MCGITSISHLKNRSNDAKAVNIKYGVVRRFSLATLFARPSKSMALKGPVSLCTRVTCFKAVAKIGLTFDP